MGLFKDFTGVVKNVFGIKAGSNLFLSVFNNGKQLGVAPYSAAADGSFTDLEAGTLRTVLSSDHSITSGINLDTTAEFLNVNVGYGALASRLLSVDDILTSTKVSDWTVSTRFDTRMTCPMVSGVITSISSLNVGIFAGRVYLYTGSDTVTNVNPLVSTNADLRQGDLFMAFEQVSSSGSASGKIIPLSRNITTTFTTASSLAGTLANSSVILNPGIAGASGYTLYPNAVYANDSVINAFGRTGIIWTRKTPEPYVASSAISSGIIKISLNQSTGTMSTAKIPAGCMVKGVIVKVDTAVSVATWSLKLKINSGTPGYYELMNGSECYNLSSTETQKDDMFYNTDMDTYDSNLYIETGAGTGSATAYVHYEALYS